MVRRRRRRRHWDRKLVVLARRMVALVSESGGGGGVGRLLGLAGGAGGGRDRVRAAGLLCCWSWAEEEEPRVRLLVPRVMMSFLRGLAPIYSHLPTYSRAS